MKPRHAAALALVGWYLMAAPSNPTSALLSQWRIIERMMTLPIASKSYLCC
jgi:hypothetical protein